MIYILDAYNVIHKSPLFQRALSKGLRASREELISVCAKLTATRGDIPKIILVFDGKSEYRDLDLPSPPKVKLIFSETGEDADERIVEVLEGLTNQAKCVVSDDNFVRNQARAYQTRVMPVKEFEQLFQNTGPRKSQPPSTADKGSLSQRQADDITAAYKKHLGL